MADQRHLAILKQGVRVWNKWRKEHPLPDTLPDLREADLRGADLSGADLSGADLREADLSSAALHDAFLCEAKLRYTKLFDAVLIGADLSGADLSGANLCKASLWAADFSRANLSGADLSHACLSIAPCTRAGLRVPLSYGVRFRGGYANLSGASLSRARLHGADLHNVELSGADLSRADLREANLREALLVGTNLTGATLTGCSIYGISVWSVKLEGAIQNSLVVTPEKEPIITVDNLKVAQFIYLLLDNKEIREVIDTATRKVVLILGRFTPERKAVLDAIRNELRRQNYLPIVCDSPPPASRDLTETVSILAHLARFIIVDLTDPSSVPHEVATIIPQCVVPVQPLLGLQPLIVDGRAVERHEYAMFEDLRRRYRWVLPTFRYKDTASLIASLKVNVIDPAEWKVKELAKR